MKTEISNEFILEAHKEACSTWKARIEKECPELFKKTLEVGKWYKDLYLGHLGFREKDNGNYGFLYGEWNTEIECKTPKQWTLATEQEVKEALINEAKKRGFVGEHKIKWFFDSVNYCLTYPSLCVFNCHNNTLMLGGGIVFKDGVWAEIVKEPTEIELIKAEIEKLNERLNKLL